MKRISLIITFLLSFGISQSHAQEFDLGKLDNVISMLNNKSDHPAAEMAIKAVLGELQQDVKVNKGAFGSKIIGQIGNLSSILPLLSKGKANLPIIQKALKVIKVLQAAQQLSALIKGKKLLGSGKSILANVGVLKSGLDLISGGSAIGKALDIITKKGAKLDKSGLGAKMAQRVITKKLGSSLNILQGLI